MAQKQLLGTCADRVKVYPSKLNKRNKTSSTENVGKSDYDDLVTHLLIDEAMDTQLPNSELSHFSDIEGEFELPRKTAKQSQVKTHVPLMTSNRFEALDITNQNDLTTFQLFVYEVKDVYIFTKNMLASRICKKTPTIVHTRNYIKFIFDNMDDFYAAKSYCQNANQQFATTIPKKDRPIKVVIRQLPIDTLVDDIKQDLCDQNFDCDSVAQLSRKDPQTSARVKLPLFLVTLPRHSNNNNSIYDLQYLLSYRIKIEKYNPPKYLQCYKCQRLHHSQKQCSANPRCVKCALNHLSKECPGLGEAANPTCVNCGGPHTANYRGCPLFVNLAKQQQNKGQNTTRKQSPVFTTEDFPNLPASDSKSYSKIVEEDRKVTHTISQNAPSNIYVSTFKEIISLCKVWKIDKIVSGFKLLAQKLHTARDPISKLTIIIETLAEIFDGTK